MKIHLSFTSLKSLPILTIVISAALLTSCNKQDEHNNLNTLSITLLTDDTLITRASINNTWNGGEQVQVSINNGSALTFTASPSGTLTPVSPIYWQSPTQSISARAWYPASWTFPTNQSAGLQSADFIFASTVTGITFSNYATNPLTFQHRTAKVTVNLTAGTDINSVTNATVSFYGFTSGAPNTSDAGNGVIAGSGNGWINPYNTSGDTYTALLMPRDMTGIQFIKITLDGIDYFYTPAAGDAELLQGKAYIYNITVNKTRLDVEVIDGIIWTYDNEYDIEPRFL